jgi:hypothetical protein
LQDFFLCNLDSIAGCSAFVTKHKLCKKFVLDCEKYIKRLSSSQVAEFRTTSEELNLVVMPRLNVKFLGNWVPHDIPKTNWKNIVVNSFYGKNKILKWTHGLFGFDNEENIVEKIFTKIEFVDEQHDSKFSTQYFPTSVYYAPVQNILIAERMTNSAERIKQRVNAIQKTFLNDFSMSNLTLTNSLFSLNFENVMLLSMKLETKNIFTKLSLSISTSILRRC